MQKIETIVKFIKGKWLSTKAHFKTLNYFFWLYVFLFSNLKIKVTIL